MEMHQQGGVANSSVNLNAGIDVSKLHLNVCLGATEQRVLDDAYGWNDLTAVH
jgi:transposase